MIKEIVIAISSAVVSGIFSVLVVHLNNKSKLDGLSKEVEMEKDRSKNELQRITSLHTIEINKLNTQLDLKDKDMETLRLKHELMEKSKETDGTNPIMVKFLEEFIKDPEKASLKLENIQKQAEKFNPGKKLQGYKKPKK